MNFLKKNALGILICLSISIPSYFLGKMLPVIGGAVFAILFGMAISIFWKTKEKFDAGIKFTSKKILQYAVILLGFGLNLGVVLQTGKQSLPIIVCTITTSLLIAFVLCKVMKIHGKTATLIGVGSSICGGSAIAATAPVVDADDEEVAQAISVIFFFNVLAALIFPTFGKLIGFDQTSGEAFGIFAGTAVNDTSSVTACASTWDSMFNLGSETLDKAVTVKLTRTLAIIPITLCLAFWKTRQAKKNSENAETKKVSLKSIFPMFILYFVLASLITTLVDAFIGNDFVICKLSESVISFSTVFGFMKNLSKFFIIMAMAAIGLNTNIVKLVKTGGKPLILGASCWIGITTVSLILQKILGLF